MYRQLPVYSPVSLRSLTRGLAGVFGGGENAAALADALKNVYGAASVILTNSGTDALVAAIRARVPRGGTVALPSYACIDLAAAAVAARVRVRLYDLDPHTLSVDAASLERALARGAEAVVAAHLYGYPSDMRVIAELCARAGAHVIEDAAQGEGGSLDARPLGGFGPLSVLSFGRGKGLTGGGGGALLAFDGAGDISNDIGETLQTDGSRVRPLAVAGALWFLGRPELYWIPSLIPWLALGEMVYHPAGEPRAITATSAAIVRSALEASQREVEQRRRNAERIALLCESAQEILPIRVVRGESGFLRFAALDLSGQREALPRAGILRGYPLTVAGQEPVRELLLPGESDLPGACELRDRLFTIPVHSRVRERDFAAIRRWLMNAS